MHALHPREFLFTPMQYDIIPHEENETRLSQEDNRVSRSKLGRLIAVHQLPKPHPNRHGNPSFRLSYLRLPPRRNEFVRHETLRSGGELRFVSVVRRDITDVLRKVTMLPHKKEHSF